MIRIVIGCFLILFVLVIARMIYENGHYKITEYVITDKNLPPIFTGQTWLLLADLHNCKYGNNNDNLIQSIKELHPDGILVAGDMVVKTKPGYDYTLAFFAAIKDVAPIYYVNGNHENRLRDSLNDEGKYFSEYSEMLTKMGVVMLNNGSVAIRKKGAQIVIHGLDLSLDYYRDRKKILTKEEIKKQAGNVSKHQYDILIAHNPEFFSVYGEYGANLIVAGHNHGGMVYLPRIGGVLSTGARLFPKFDKGVFEYGDSKMVLSAGLGSHTIKVRLFNQPEVVKIVLLNE